jgi:ABC-type branched-subunit amino acid transport system substrate-binding protein
MRSAHLLPLMLGCRLLAAGPDLAVAADPAPYTRLRENTLRYHGPADEFTNLTDIPIGWFGPTNLDDPLAGDLWWAANLAVQEANTRTRPPGSGIGPFARLPIRLVPRWAADPWGSGVSQLTRMIYDERPLALIGSVDSASTHLAEQVVAKANLPLVSPVATDASVTLAGVPWMFACAPSDDAIARTLVDDILVTVGPAATGRCRLALVSCTDHDSRMTVRAVRRELSRRGRLPDLQFEVPSGGVSLARQQAELTDARPALVLVIASPEDAARWVTVVREAAPAARVVGGPNLGRARFRELAGTTADGIWFPQLLAGDPRAPEQARFTTRFLGERGHRPDYAAVLTYDATRLLIEAIHQAGPNRARIRDTLAQFPPWPGLAGTIRFDGTGQNTRTDLCMGTLAAGAIAGLIPP